MVKIKTYEKPVLKSTGIRMRNIFCASLENPLYSDPDADVTVQDEIGEMLGEW